MKITILVLKDIIFKKNQKEINNFIDQIQNIKRDFNELEIIIDLLEIDESDYHNGFLTLLYIPKTRENCSVAVDIKVQNEDCVGFWFLENFTSETSIQNNMKK